MVEIHIIDYTSKFDFTYCGQNNNRHYVTNDFKLPMNIMCRFCVDMWENEPKSKDVSHKTKKLMDVNKKD